MVKVFFIIGIIAFFISGASMGAWTDRQGFHEETKGAPEFSIKKRGDFCDNWGFIFSDSAYHLLFPK